MPSVRCALVHMLQNCAICCTQERNGESIAFVLPHIGDEFIQHLGFRLPVILVHLLLGSYINNFLMHWHLKLAVNIVTVVYI